MDPQTRTTFQPWRTARGAEVMFVAVGKIALVEKADLIKALPTHEHQRPVWHIDFLHRSLSPAARPSPGKHHASAKAGR